MSQFKSMDLEQHVEVGQQLKDIRNRATRARSQLWPHLPRSGPIFKKLQQIIDLSMDISSRLEERMYCEIEEGGLNTVYFGRHAPQPEKE